MNEENFNVGDIVRDKHWGGHHLIVEYNEEEDLVVCLDLKYNEHHNWSVKVFKNKNYKVS